MSHKTVQMVDDEWMTFPGGELEGRRVKALCPGCREQLKRVAVGKGGDAIRPRAALCFQCYRAELDSACGPREHSESAPAARVGVGPHANEITSGTARASDSPEPKALGVGPQRREESGAPRAVENVRWQWLLPFEPVNKPRLERLKAERVAARATIHVDAGRYADKRRQAQIAARHALDAIAAGLDLGQLAPTERDRLMDGAIHAAELQLPESWLAFVVAR